MRNNPHAFPQGNEWMDAEGNMRLIHEGGMTLRDYFAGQALVGLVTRSSNGPTSVEIAYALADAMLAQRTKGDAA
jgi:hypothetical protein